MLKPMFLYQVIDGSPSIRECTSTINL